MRQSPPPPHCSVGARFASRSLALSTRGPFVRGMDENHRILTHFQQCSAAQWKVELTQFHSPPSLPSNYNSTNLKFIPLIKRQSYDYCQESRSMQKFDAFSFYRVFLWRLKPNTKFQSQLRVFAIKTTRYFHRSLLPRQCRSESFQLKKLFQGSHL